MLETRKLFATGLTLAVLATTGCYKFDEAFEACVDAGRCDPEKCDSNKVDEPDPLFFDANCDGIDGDPDDAFFVDPAVGNDSPGAGTREVPFKSLSFALQQAVGTGKALYLAQGTYPEPALRMNTPTSLYGGYTGVDGGWARGRDYDTHIQGGRIGLTVSGLDAGLVLERLRITSANAVDAGTPSIGVRVLDSSGVRLRYVRVLAGAGASGVEGFSPPRNPQIGEDGGPGVNPSAGSTFPADGGSPGRGLCSNNAGGTGGRGNPSFATSPATPGEPGQPSAAGGDGGVPVEEVPPCPTASSCDYYGGPGGEGQNGQPGDAGTNGSPGNGIGRITSDTWVPEFGSDGGLGSAGGGGGGGGGGGSILASSQISPGGGGGGGGAGGCAGTGATGGGGGGASIAVLLIQSQIDLESCTLETAGGGQGGTGGKGGEGSAGGQGAPGGVGPRRSFTTTATYNLYGGRGGKGGNGGAGGPGGNGGNGGGGPSVGVWCGPASSVSAQRTGFNLGDAGVPGGSPLAEGEAGLQTHSRDCMPPL